MDAARELRVLLVAEDPLARSGLAHRLASERGIVVSGETAAADLSTSLGEREAEVVLQDLGQAGGAPLVEGAPAVALVPDAASAARALARGARGVLPRSAERREIAAALRAVAAGLVVLSVPLADSLLSRRQRPGEEAPEPLTPREVEVLSLLARGLANKEIAHRLAISEHTAKFHVNAILEKLGAQSRVQAVVRAAQLGLVVL